MASVATDGGGDGVENEGEDYWRNLVSELTVDRKVLRDRVEALERENRDLRKSVHELSVRVGVVKPTNGSATAASVASALQPAGSAGRKVADVPEASSDRGSEAGEKVTRFRCKLDMLGHTGAVYAARFSSDGQLLATGSLDWSVRIWDIDKAESSAAITLTDAHASSVSSLAWAPDSASLFSGGFDHCVREWDISSACGTAVVSHPARGFVQALVSSPASNSVTYAGTSRKTIHCMDKRSPLSEEESVVVNNDSMVNALYMERDGTKLISGDHHGMLKTWDIRKIGTRSSSGNTVSTPVGSTPNGSDGSPVTCICGSPLGLEDDEDSLLATNSYDNVLRVYGRGANILDAKSRKMELLHPLRGPMNRNWPIKSSFFRGERYAAEAHRWSRQAEDDDLDDVPSLTPGIHGSLLLASGSSDGTAHVYSVGKLGRPAEVVQVLRGHSDRVYTATFHPVEPILATAAADARVKIWVPNRGPD